MQSILSGHCYMKRNVSKNYVRSDFQLRDQPGAYRNASRGTSLFEEYQEEDPNLMDELDFVL